MSFLKQIRPLLYTAQMRETVDFYTRVLGFRLAAAQEDGSWAAVARDGIEFGISPPNAHIPFTAAVFTGSFYITVDDVDALWQEWRDLARICYPLEDFPYGMREFALYDNNGYLLQFGQEL